jgi:uncharacterized protein (DUF433 family)
MRSHALRGSNDKFVRLLGAQWRQGIAVELRPRLSASPCVTGMRIPVDAVDDNLLAAGRPREGAYDML